MPATYNRNIILIIVTMVLLLLPGLLLEHGSGQNVMNFRSRQENNKDLNSGDVPQVSNYTITGNITVSTGATLRFSGNDLEAYSTSTRHIGITIWGRLVLDNSSLNIMNATGNSVTSISIDVERGGSLYLYNSVLYFNGSINANGSTIFYDDSLLNSPGSGASQFPESTKWLAENYNASNVHVFNTTIDGLYVQRGIMSFQAARSYMSDPFFARNGTILFSGPFGILGSNPYIDGIELNISYYGNYNGTGGNLSIYYDGTDISNVSLKYNGTSGKTYHGIINLSTEPEPTSWYSNSSNFHATLQESSAGPIEITNISATLISNDTEAVLGKGAFGIYLENSYLESVNSSFGLDLEPLMIHGYPDFKNRHLAAYNSTVVLNDTGIGNDTFSGGTAFQINDSRIFIYRTFLINATDNDSAIRNFLYTVNPEIIPAVNASVWSGRHHPLVVANGNYFTVLSGMMANSTYLYTGDYDLNWSSSSEMISTRPFPFLSEGFRMLSVNATAPEVRVMEINSSANSTEDLVNVTYFLGLPQGSHLNGSFTLTGISSSGSKVASLSFSAGDTSGIFSRIISIPGDWTYGDTIGIVFNTQQEYYIPQDSMHLAKVAFSLPGNHMPTDFNLHVYDSGIPADLFWELHAGNESYLISEPSYILTIAGYPSHISVTAPPGYKSSIEFKNLSSSSGNIYVNFTRIVYSISFSHEGTGSNFTWSVTISGNRYTTSSQDLTVNVTPGVHEFYISVPRNTVSNVTLGVLNVTGNSTVLFRISPIFPWYEVAGIYLHSFTAYLAAVIVAAVVVAEARYRRSHSWHLCKSCGITVDHGKKYCPQCSESKGRGKY